MCNIEFTTELLFVWASDEQRIPTVRTGEVSAHRKQLLHCARDDGREGSTQRRKTPARERPIGRYNIYAPRLCFCVVVAPVVLPPVLSFVCASRAERARETDAFDEIQIPRYTTLSSRSLP